MVISFTVNKIDIETRRAHDGAPNSKAQTCPCFDGLPHCSRSSVELKAYGENDTI